MKKRLLLILLIFTLFSSPTIYAVKYRGFVDASLGYFLTPFHPENDKEDSKRRIEFDLTTTHGVQINKLFVGAGTGILLPEVSFPLYVAGRYDFWGKHGINPYVSLRVGYIFRVKGSYLMGRLSYETHDTYLSNGIEYREEYRWNEGYYAEGLYVQPQVGARFRMGRNTGFNLGISLNLINLKEMKEVGFHSIINLETGDTHYSYERKFEPIGSNKISPVINLLFGFDF